MFAPTGFNGSNLSGAFTPVTVQKKIHQVHTRLNLLGTTLVDSSKGKWLAEINKTAHNKLKKYTNDVKNPNQRTKKCSCN
jgi:hypothetical protein